MTSVWDDVNQQIDQAKMEAQQKRLAEAEEKAKQEAERLRKQQSQQNGNWI